MPPRREVRRELLGQPTAPLSDVAPAGPALFGPERSSAPVYKPAGVSRPHDPERAATYRLLERHYDAYVRSDEERLEGPPIRLRT